MAKRYSDFISVMFFLTPFLLGFTHAEFPNYFEEAIKRDNPMEQEGQSLLVQQQVERAIHSILSRLEVPYYENGKLQTKGFFSHLERVVKEKDPDAKVGISGGVVRSALGYLYEKIYSAKQKDPQVKTLDILKNIIAGKNWKGETKETVLGTSFLGVASDMDVMIELSPKGKAKEKEIKTDAETFINSAKTHLNLQDDSSNLRKALVLDGDVQWKQAQLQESVRQGGSTLD